LLGGLRDTEILGVACLSPYCVYQLVGGPHRRLGVHGNITVWRLDNLHRNS